MEATEAASLAVSAVGADGQGHLTVDIRADRAVLRLQSAEAGWVTGRDIRLAHRVSGALAARGLQPTPGGSVQALEIAIDALDIPAVRPFWKAITGYADEPGSELQAALVDPSGRGPAIWFQQMDAPRPQRNRIHIDVDVPPRRPALGSTPRSPRAARCSAIRRRRLFGCWPTPRATRPASVHGKAGIDVTAKRHEACEPPETLRDRFRDAIAPRTLVVTARLRSPFIPVAAPDSRHRGGTGTGSRADRPVGGR